jgi:hypothetical protein
VLAGRNFRAGDPQTFVIINKALADRFFGNEDPIGKRIGWMMDWQPDTLKWQTVIGVVGNTRDGALDAEPRAVVFWPLQQTPVRSAGLVIRSDHRVGGLETQAMRVVRSIDPDALIEQVATISEFKERSVSPRRLNAVLISSFGALAVIIAMVGIAGVLAFSVSARTNEIGIRMSLGADAGRVQRMILRGRWCARDDWSLDRDCRSVSGDAHHPDAPVRGQAARPRHVYAGDVDDGGGGQSSRAGFRLCAPRASIRPSLRA